MVWSWDTFNTWIDVWFAVGVFSWESDWLGETISESLSLWSVWAVLETGWIFDNSSVVSWNDVLWPWGGFLECSEGIWEWDTGLSWIDVWFAVSFSSWESNWLGDSISEGLSFWSVWAVFKTGWIFSSRRFVSWNDVLWPWCVSLGKSIWEWDTGLSWIDVWFAVGIFSWESDWLGETISESLSLWSVWAVLETGWIFDNSSVVSWNDVLWPWGGFLECSEGIWEWDTGLSWIDVWFAVSFSSWESNWLGDSISEGLSFWSVWAVFKTGWIFSSRRFVSWNDVLWPWCVSLGKSIWEWDTGLSWIDVWFAVGIFSWESDWLGETISESLSLWSVWAVLETGWIFDNSSVVSWNDVLWPWGGFLECSEGIWEWDTGLSWIDVWFAVGVFSWESDWLGKTISEGLSFWSVWAVFEASWIFSSRRIVSWNDVLWPWGSLLNKGPGWVAVESSFWVCDSNSLSID